MHKGSCLCGVVNFEVTGKLKSPSACHCTICRKWTGHFSAGTDVPRDTVTIQGADNVTWYRSSDKVRRGFCSTCGSSLFFDPIDKDKHDWTGIEMGAFEQPTNTHLEEHIFVTDKGDYYDIKDGLPQKGSSPDDDHQRNLDNINIPQTYVPLLQ